MRQRYDEPSDRVRHTSLPHSGVVQHLPALGRTLVALPDQPIPDAWSDAPIHRLDASVLGDHDRATALADTLHRLWGARTPYVVELAVDPAELREPERVVAPPWEVGADHLFPRERLQFLVWTNAVDARSGTPVWWWARKAEAFGATAGGPADVLLPDGTPAFVDGGPRGPLPDLGHPVVHAESVRLGSLTPMPSEPEPADDAFDPGQRAAVLHGAGPARIIAPAGSGKTRTLIGRVDQLVRRGVEPASILAVAYNRRAREELMERLPATARGIEVRTIHALGWSILRQAEPNVRLLSEREVRRTLDRLVPARRQSNTDPLGAYLEALTAVRVGFRDPEEVEAIRDDAPDFSTVLRRYRDRLRSSATADHEEQVLGAIEVLLADPVLRAERQSRHRHVLVDEFQDLTPAYLLLLRIVAAPELAVFGVGDDDQTIYGYSGADPAFLIDYERWFPGADGHALTTNYRSVAPIVDTASTLLTHNRRRVDKEIVAAPGAPSPDDAVVVRRAPSAELAVRGAAQLASWLDAGERDLAVLARVHAALLPLHLACQEAAVPTSIDLEPGFLDRTGVASALAWLRIARNPGAIAAVDLAHAARRPPSGVVGLVGELLGGADTSLRELQRIGRTLDGRQAAMWWKLVDRVERLERLGRSGDTAEILGAVVDDEGLAASALKLDHSRPAGAGGHTDDLVAVTRAAELHPDPDTFGDWLAERLARPSPEDAIRLTTVHRVKGLEWDRVLVFGVDDGTLPHRLAEDLEEERRILHVAVTRARRQVVVMADEARPSPFLDELAEPRRSDAPARTTTSGAGSRSGVHVSVGDRITASGGYTGTVEEVGDDRVVLRLPAGGRMKVVAGEQVRSGSRSGPLVVAGGDLRERLRRFRLDEAARRDVPAFVVFNDRTLDALVEARPTTRTELLTIPGIGPAKLESYGDQILAALTEG